MNQFDPFFLVTMILAVCVALSFTVFIIVIYFGLALREYGDALGKTDDGEDETISPLLGVVAPDTNKKKG